MGLGNLNDTPSPMPRPCRPSTLFVSSNNNQSHSSNNEVGCQCCPYGFHIDLDFVRFCESLATGEHLKQKREERRTRRLQCNSMEVLLGLTTPSYTSVLVSSVLPPIIDVPRESDSVGATLDSRSRPSRELNRAVDDFEATFSQSSRHSQSSQISCFADIIFNSTSSLGKDSDADCSFEIKNEALQSVRGQMAASLEKLRELEQQVKLIPVLQVKVSVLQEEKRQMALQLQELKNKFIRGTGPLKKEMGVGTLSSTLKDGVSQTENWIKSVSSKMIQTFLQPLTESGTQTMTDANANKLIPAKISQFVQVSMPMAQEMVPRGNAETQTDRDLQVFHPPPITYRPIVFHRHVQTQGEEKVVPSFPPPAPKPIVLHRQVQTDREPIPRTIQPSQSPTLRRPNVFHRQVQTDSSLLVATKQEGFTIDRHQQRKSIAIGDGAINDVICDRCLNLRTRHVSCGTTDLIRPASGVNVATQSYSVCQECEARSKIDAVETIDQEIQTNDSCFNSPRLSRVSRLGEGTFPSVPQANQSPLQKANFEPTNSRPQSESESESSREDDESDLGSDESIREEEDEEEDDDENERIEPILEPAKPRISMEPSMEMKAALKVLNDSIHRPQRGSSKLLVNAIEIVRREWIQVSSTKEADAHSVEDYMDYIESLSMALLERVANLSDNNGNTSLHYAVSHSQWDIVSLLLDSKVCYPQLRNKAGYSPPMLAALAQPTNNTESQVLQRLFSLCDVNSKATQHGQTALMLSVSHGRVEVVRLLLAAGADVNVQDADGSTALMCAAEHGHTTIVKLLLAQTDIDLHLRDNDGSTALSIAMEAGNKDIGLLIYAHMNFHGSKSSSTTSSPVLPTASPSTTLRRKGSPLPYL
ncbi:KN motif and ankyrin repeat domain-containing protein 3 isoform X2 [Daphnia magna]|uniref:KN motif and ankyrin repeat domain-containing protein 3 isoform X2 n=1 Tax=Daphnia magna TaxID=35525 RepID=UPI001E1BA04D|nr:KN motif and ankyrin repeat domain-containing protein 3 isoform X2 [Daphnia magna]